jgi:hypothetical protein
MTTSTFPKANRKGVSRVRFGDLLEAKRMEEKHKHALHRYACARRRARYWSGNPSWSNNGPKGKNLTTCRMDERYELAMCDCLSWESELERITGKKIPHYDPKAEFRAKFSKMLFASNASDQRPGANT